MTKDLHAPNDNAWLFEYPKLEEKIELDEVSISGDSKELAIITYGNGYYVAPSS